MAIDDGGPAFPIPLAGCTDGGVYNILEQSGGKLGGMSLRDHFAGLAMNRVLAERLAPLTVDDAKLCYVCADAMLAARKGNGNG